MYKKAGLHNFIMLSVVVDVVFNLYGTFWSGLRTRYIQFACVTFDIIHMLNSTKLVIYIKFLTTLAGIIVKNRIT